MERYSSLNLYFISEDLGEVIHMQQAEVQTNTWDPNDLLEL